MGTLLLRLAGPMQSWGTQSRFDDRDTGLEPSKSGVIGLLCAALGRSRHDPVTDLAELRMGVRVDREGVLMMDYHTVGGGRLRGPSRNGSLGSSDGADYGVATVDGKVRRVVPSFRHYLSDADFLVGIESHSDDQLRQLQDALQWPRWQLFLGRKSFVPSIPVYLPDGLKIALDLRSALRSYPWPALGGPAVPPHKRPQRLRLVEETDVSCAEDIRRDQPLGAAYYTRDFGQRYVRTVFLELGSEVPLRLQPQEDPCTSLD